MPGDWVAEQDCSIYRLRLAGASAARSGMEAAWLQALSQHGLPVPAPRAGRDGRVVQVAQDASSRRRHALLLQWLPLAGRMAGQRPLRNAQAHLQKKTGPAGPVLAHGATGQKRWRTPSATASPVPTLLILSLISAR
jgi:hypothetical protein